MVGFAAEEAGRHHQAALDARRAQNLPGPAGLSLSAMGAVALARGHYPRALEAYQEAWGQFKAGIKDVVFPAGTYWMGRHAGLRAAPPD